MPILKAHLISYQTHLEMNLWKSHWVISDIAACPSLTCAWPLDFLCSPGCPAYRCLATAKAGDHSCWTLGGTQDSFLTDKMDTASSGLFHQLLSQKEAPTGFSSSLADTQVCHPEQNPSLSIAQSDPGLACRLCRRMQEA